MNENPSTAPQTSSTIQPTVPYLQSIVTHYTGATVLQSERVLLVWGTDGRIQAVTSDAQARVLFDVTTREINEVSIALSQLILVINGQKYRFDFSNGATTKGLIVGGVTLGMGGLGLVPGLMADKYVFDQAKQSGAGEWIASLERQNVPIKGSTDPNHLTKFATKVTLIGFGAFFGAFLLFFIAYMINE